MEENKKKKSRSKAEIITFFICVIIGGLAGYYGTFLIENMEIAGFDWIYIILGVFVTFYLQIIMHEAGHLVCGLISGYKFVSFRIGNLILYKKAGKLHWGKYSIAGTGGQCLMSPPDMTEGKIPYRLYNFGGALMNIFVSLIAMGFFFTAGSNMVVKAISVVCAGIGLVFALTNGIPMRLGGIDNDGYNALSLGKNPQALRALWIQLKANEFMTEGTRLKDMPEEWFEKPAEEDMKNNMIAAIEAMRCNRMLDELKFAEANEAISEAVNGENGMVGVQKMLLQVDRMYCEIFGERREEVFSQMQDKMLGSFMKTMKNYPSILRTRYAYALLIEKDEIKAAKWKKQFEKVMKTHPIQGEADSEWELVNYAEESCGKTQN